LEKNKIKDLKKLDSNLHTTLSELLFYPCYSAFIHFTFPFPFMYFTDALKTK